VHCPESVSRMAPQHPTSESYMTTPAGFHRCSMRSPASAAGRQSCDTFLTHPSWLTTPHTSQHCTFCRAEISACGLQCKQFICQAYARNNVKRMCHVRESWNTPSLAKQVGGQPFLETILREGEPCPNRRCFVLKCFSNIHAKRFRVMNGPGKNLHGVAKGRGGGMFRYLGVCIGLDPVLAHHAQQGSVHLVGTQAVPAVRGWRI